ncbi:RWD domain protein [Oesophagostomum dentatum]|uniref:RWD domain protein n=1 Tax=Oesophagostomum dentatum TaxID=61180 RepID=A0A0B1T9T2_OESDE|nr:RWD domain protein [Oesophagostomum dentatum]
MLKQFPAEQTDEIDAVISYFGEEFVSVDQSGSELSGIISVVLEPKAKPIVLSAADGTDYGRFETTQLSPIDLHFRLPVEYPDKEAIFDVYSIWLPDPMRTTILKRLAKIAQENLGFPVLFLCCEDVKKFVEEEDMTEVFLGRNNYARKHNLRPMEILERAREECERAELREFEAHCYDCNVCDLVISFQRRSHLLTFDN